MRTTAFMTTHVHAGTRTHDLPTRSVSPALLALMIPPGDAQLFSRYPVLKIQTTAARSTTKNASVIARLMPTLTSELS